MKKINIALFVFSLTVASIAQAGDFDGAYVGANVGNNKSSKTSLADKNNAYLGLKAGYNWDWDSFLLGAEAFVDTHSNGYSGQDAGLDGRFGIPLDRWLPYIKLGVVGTSPGGRLHGGLGVEYRLSDNWSINTEWTTDRKDVGIRGTYKNNNIALGLNYRFGAESTKSTPVAVVDTPVVAKAAINVPVVEKPVPEKIAPKPVFKTIFSDKTLTLEGTSFDTGSAKLKESANEQLGQVVAFANEYKDSNLVVTGYTDNRGDAKKNLTLSAARAESVKVYLVKHGIAAERISTKGEGETKPVADNETAEGRAKNRRVEINSVVKEEQRVRVQ